MVLQPQQCLNIIGLGYSAFARHYLRTHFYFLLLWVIRCFSSPRSLTTSWCDRSSTWRVAPFGNLRVKGYLLLTVAYRSLSRPSSPPRAKASSMRPYLLSDWLLKFPWVIGQLHFFWFLLLSYFFEIASILIFALLLFFFQYVNELRVENNGFEPLTPCVQGRCSSQLS